MDVNTSCPRCATSRSAIVRDGKKCALTMPTRSTPTVQALPQEILGLDVQSYLPAEIMAYRFNGQFLLRQYDVPADIAELVRRNIRRTRCITKHAERFADHLAIFVDVFCDRLKQLAVHPNTLRRQAAALWLER